MSTGEPAHTAGRFAGSPAWILLAFVALWWPSRLDGPLDGIPLDTAAGAIVLGLVVPVLCWFAPAFLNDRRARAILVALLAWKAATTATLVADGWCAGVVPSRPYVRDGAGPPHSWDVRTDWLSANPKCSAIATRSFTRMDEFPVWFFNLPAANGDTPHPGDVPPEAKTDLSLRGSLVTTEAGVFRLVTSPDIVATTQIDGAAVPVDGVTLPAGAHAVIIDATLTGEHWLLQPLWNEADMWGRVTATVAPASPVDLMVRPWGRWVTGVLVSVLLLGWAAAALAIAADAWVVAWMVVASAGMAVVARFVPEQRWHFVMALLIVSAVLPVRESLRNLRGAFLLLGVPWLVFGVVVNAFEQGFGRMTFYSPGNDWWQFQRYSYRIFLQGYWLEGGEKTFWFQPLYRWIAGALHLVFGDSSLGEDYWDGAGVLVMALFAFHVARAVAGFRWGLVAGALTIVSFIAGPGYIFVGHGLSEISSAGFIYLAALFALRSREGSWRMALGAGAFATLGTWTRLNNLPMAMAVLAFAWPLDEPIRTIWRPRQWLTRASMPALVIVPATVAAGLALFALRTWHYTGTFSVFLGTQGTARAIWQPGMSAGEALGAVLGSLMMVLTTTDPPRLHNGALPVILGAVVSVAALSGVGLLGQLPMSAVLFCLASLAGSLVARGSAYSGRFSIHVIGASITVLTCAMSLALSKVLELRRGRPVAAPGGK